MQTCPIQIPLSSEQWLMLDVVSSRQGLSPVEYVAAVLTHNLADAYQREHHRPRLYRVLSKTKI